MVTGCPLDIALIHPVPPFFKKPKGPLKIKHTSMLFRALFFTSLPLLAFGVNIRRQDVNATDSATVPPTVVGGATTTTTAPTSLSPPPDVPFTLVSSNPTAFPLSDIDQSPSTHPTVPLETTPTAGQEPTAITNNAPPLPTGLFLFIFIHSACFCTRRSVRSYFCHRSICWRLSAPAVLPTLLFKPKLTLDSFLIIPI